MIDTLDNVKARLLIAGSADDALLNQLRAAASAFVERHCGRSFEGGSFTELHPGHRSLAFLRNYPIATVSSLKVDATRQFGVETIRDPTEYLVHTDRGMIESLRGSFLAPASRRSPGTVQVNYTVATGEVPAAVCEAFTQLIGQWYRQSKTDVSLNFRMLTEETTAAGSAAYPWSLATGLRIPPTVLQLLQSYRVPAG